MKDRSDELSTADLAGQGAGSGAVDERAVRDEGADRTGEQHDGFPGERGTDAGYADGRDADAPDRAYADDQPFADEGGYGQDRAGGIGSPGLSGGSGPDGAAGVDRAGYADDTAMATGRGGESTMSPDRAGDLGDTGAGGTGYADDTAMTGRGSGAGGTGVGGKDVGGTGVAGDVGGTGVAGSGVGGSGVAGSGIAATGVAGNGVAGNQAGPLLGSAEAEGFRARWTDVQTGFVDEPRHAVEQADGLTAELMQHLAKTFADERLRLEQQWDSGDDIPTDELRAAFQRYRSFFERLLST